MTARAQTRLVAGFTALLVSGSVLFLGAGPAAADSAPPVPGPATPTTVAADGLPTTQINGVVWSQVVVGDTVFAAGSFTRARPAGAARGTAEVVRNNLLSYDIRTGVLNTSFAPSLNGQALVVAASPDGTKLYVGGDFTQADGQVRNRVAGYDIASGALLPNFRPSASSQVRAIAATDDTVYIGGSLTAIGGVARNRLAAVRASDGALLPWAPQPGVGSTAGNSDGNKATSNAVMALALTTAGGNQVVAAGRFDTMNGTKNTGVAAVDPVSGANRPFAVNKLITNQGVNSAIYSLSTDGTTVYGSGYDYYGPGNVEGTFAAQAAGGALVAFNDCHGDTYSTFPMNGALYISSHAHVCSNIGGFPESSPTLSKFATAVTLVPTRTVGTATLKNRNFAGQPAPSVLPWYPDLSTGTVTGAYQAGWSVSGNSRYVVYGGEFPRVNGVDQQGLVRFALPGTAPDRIGPAAAATLTPAVTSPAAGTARLTWRATSDRDNEYLTYRVHRDDDTAAPVYEVRQASQWWQTPAMSWTDPAVPGGSHRYRVTATDPFGNRVASAWATVTVAAGANLPPTALFTSSSTGLTASFDGTTSTDPDGSITSWAWNFGDSTTGSGARTTHTYAAAGTYPVRLTVTDSAGVTGSRESSVTVSTAPPGPVVQAADAFARTVAPGGLGTADVGGAWTVASGGARQSVTPGVATLALAAPGNLTGSYLGSVAQTGTDVLASFSVSAAATGGGVSVYVTGRRVAVNQEYRARVRITATGAVAVGLTRLSGTASEVLVVPEVTLPGLTYSPGTVLRMRVRVIGAGTTQLSATVWTGGTEPVTPTVTGSDTTASLQAAGSLGLWAYLSGSATSPVDVRFTGLRAVAAP